MGVPAFYRWLSSKYPKIVVDAVKKDFEGCREIREWGDACRWKLNPRCSWMEEPSRSTVLKKIRMELNMIIFMLIWTGLYTRARILRIGNAVGEGGDYGELRDFRPPPQSEEEMFKAVTMYLERLISVVRPRKLLFLAIDGVAPRAKMNQQRARRSDRRCRSLPSMHE